MPTTGPNSICFMTKNQADITLKSSEQDYINWQRMLAASLNVRIYPAPLSSSTTTTNLLGKTTMAVRTLQSRPCCDQNWRGT